MTRTVRPFAAALALGLGACSTLYTDLKVDEKTGLYPTATQVDAASVKTSVTSVDPKSFPVVLMVTSSDTRASGLEFTLRSALAQLGITRVYTSQEFRLYAADKRLPLSDGRITPEVVQKFSADVAPVMVVNASLVTAGTRTSVVLRVFDGRNGQALLRVEYGRTIWSDQNTEALLPVLNQLRGWAKASAKEGT